MSPSKLLATGCLVLALLSALHLDARADAPLQGVVASACGGQLSDELFVARFPRKVTLRIRDAFHVFRDGRYIGSARVVSQPAPDTTEAVLIKDFPEEALAGDVVVFRRHSSGPHDPITIDCQVDGRFMCPTKESGGSPGDGGSAAVAFLVSEGSTKVTAIIDGRKRVLEGTPTNFTDQALLSGPLCYTTLIKEEDGKKFYMPRYVSMADRTVPNTNVLTCVRLNDRLLLAADEVDRPVMVALRPDSLILSADGSRGDMSRLAVRGTRVRALLGGPPDRQELIAAILDPPLEGTERVAVLEQADRGLRSTRLTAPGTPRSPGTLFRQVPGMEIQSYDADRHLLLVWDPMVGKYLLDVPLDTVMTVSSVKPTDSYYWQEAGPIQPSAANGTLIGTRTRTSLRPGEHIDVVVADRPEGTTLVAIGTIPFRYDDPRGYTSKVLRPCRTLPDYYEIDLPLSAATVERDVFRVYRDKRCVGEAMLVTRLPVPTIVAQKCDGPLQYGDILVLERRRPMVRSYVKLRGLESTPGAAR